ncbi:MAG: PH domain-containing protein [Candidatus Gracilibacteria bacterium]|nr:PH domain-containing protein [Candidatus Gracilibacteria bacterium]MDD2909244.1 PH domain-containing protein [Candidatus Gracilibacteria bacterium]
MSINYFDEIFFSHFIKQEDDEVLDICHRHVITILDTIIVGLFFGVILPAFLYYNNSFASQGIIPFIFFETYLFVVYIILIYKIFDWYNDVWIITDKGIIDLDWKFFNKNIIYIDYNDVKGIGVTQNSAWDGILNKGEIEIHTQGEGANFGLNDAANPGAIVGYIQGILEDREKEKKDKDKTFNEKLLSTLRSVVKEHLDKNGFDEEGEKLDEEGKNALEEAKVLNKVLKKKGTIDLRI